MSKKSNNSLESIVASIREATEKALGRKQRATCPQVKKRFVDEWGRVTIAVVLPENRWKGTVGDYV